MAVFASTASVNGTPLTHLIGTSDLSTEERNSLKERVVQGGKDILNLRGRSSIQSPSYLSMEMLRTVMEGAPFRWPVGAYVNDGRFSNIVMAMETELTRSGVVIREMAGTVEEQRNPARSYSHLCELRDEVIKMGIIPEISEWQILNPYLEGRYG